MDYIDVNNTKLFDKLVLNDILLKLQEHRFLGQTHYIDKKTRKIKKLFPDGIAWATPWVHIKQDASKPCHTLQMIEKCFNFIPTACLGCWKVVVRPKNLIELFKVYNMMVQMVKEDTKGDMYCKCGVETERPFVSTLYGGYFYTTNQKDGEDRLKQVREKLAVHSPTTTAYLKRYCSEFELKHGDSKGYNQPQNAKHIEKLVLDNTEIDWTVADPPQMCIDHVMAFWVRFAYQNGDKESAMFFNDGQHLFTQPRQYEPEG